MSGPDAKGDRIVLTMAGGEELRDVATLVLGGVGSRLELPYEKVDDLQLAVLSVLAAGTADTVTLDVEIDDERVAVSIGPLLGDGASGDGLRRVLVRLVDAVEIGASGSGTARDGEWVTLRLARQSSRAG